MHVLMLLTKPLRLDPRVLREAQSLVEAGRRVTVVQWARQDPESPVQDVVKGIHVHYVHDRGWARRTSNALLKQRRWWKDAFRLASAIHARDPVHIVHAHDLDTLKPAVRLKQRYGLRLVYDAHELFYEMIRGTVPWPVPALADALERRLLRHVDLVITVSDVLRQHFARRYAGPIAVVWNSFGGVGVRYESPAAAPKRVVYIGTLTRDRLFPQLVSAIARVEGVEFVIGGKREGEWKAVEKEASRFPNVDFLGPVPADQVLKITRTGHLVVAMLDPANRQYRVALANKLFDAMACGRPILVPRGTAMERFVTDHEIGWACDFDADAVSKSVADLVSRPDALEAAGRRGLALAERTYNWDAQARVLVKAYDDHLHTHAMAASTQQAPNPYNND